MKQEFMDLKITGFSRRFHHKTAIKTDSQDISYLELEEKSNRIANFMKDKIKETPHVVTILDRSPELIESIIGLLKCGLVFVPLNPLFPGKMIKKMIDETRAEWVITSLKYYQKFEEIIKGSGTNGTYLKTLLCDGKGNGPDSHDNIFYLDSKIKKDALAFERVYNKDCYIYFTSGSTGVPKGVLGRHASLAHFIQWEIKEFKVNEDFHISQFTPPSFDPFLRDIFLPLMAGATSHIPSRDTLMNMRKLIRWIDEHKINLIHTVPSLFKKLVFEITDSNCFHHLRYILLAGELLRGRDIYKFIETFNDRIQLVNVYGPTETTLAKLFYPIKPGDVKRTIIPVGQPIDDTGVLILDSKGQKCRQGRKGEIYINTPFISSGYYNDPHLTKKLFIKNPDGKHENDIIYKTGDQGRLLRDGNIELTGRTDFQVKIRGARVELGEIENQLLTYNGIREAVVTGKEDNNGEKYLCAYVTLVSGIELDIPSLRDYLSRELPNYMIPSYFVVLEKIPLTPNGKIDRTMLPGPKEVDINPGITYLAPKNSIEKRIAEIWKEILQLDKVGVNYNFFDIGGDSLKIIAMSRKLNEEFKKEIPIPKIFANPTISFLAKYFSEMEIDKTDPDEIFEKPEKEVKNENRFQEKNEPAANKTGKEIAVIGMSCRFPGARNIEEFWKNLTGGKETISFYSHEELLNAGISHDLLSNPNYVSAVSQIKDKEYFDARFFGYTPGEAELLDPQIRFFHECSWEAIEDSGIIPDFYSGAIGVYAGAMQNLEWEMRVALSGKSRAFGLFAASKLTGIRYLCTRLAYNLNLKGPSVTMQTACSTSLVAIHLACRALSEGECDVAIAGGVTVSPEEKHGYLYEQDMIYSRDGHCRSFDAKAKGTLFGEGVGAVILKPLENALGENHHIYAVIKGSAINNDGSRKVGFTAPSVSGQSEAIRAAFQAADVEPGSITYVETHGTATTLGDPIEIEALKQAFKTDKKKYCKIGSVKSNFGHLDTAAGVAGFIKAVLSLENRMIPPSLYFETPNPEIDFDNSPFQVNTGLIEWKRGRYPLRAGINSVGMGGTNAHVILEEAPPKEESTKTREWQLILLSARTETALHRTSGNLAEFLKKNGNTNLADMAYTLQVGRQAYKYRKIVVCSTANQAIAALSTQDKRKAPIFYSSNRNPPVFFMFPGLGSQYMNMGLDLYRTEPFFCREMDLCFDIVKPILDFDIKNVLYPGREVTKTSGKDISQEMNRIEIAQVAMFIFEYVLARLLMQWGIEPQAMIGYSFGEYVAACIAGVFSLEDALKLVVLRGKLIQRLSPGAMASVPLTKEQVKPLLNNHLSLAIDNGESCIITGSKKEIEAFEEKMKKRHCICIHLPHSYAIHSQAMEPIIEEFRERVKQIPLTEHKIPYISNVTGQWITVEQATNPGYWATHLSQTVRFAEGIKELLKEPRAIFLEIGPGGDLSSMLRRYIDKSSSQIAINLVRPPRNKVSDLYYLLRQIGKLWAHGKRINWHHFYAQEKRHIISLPTYPFERQRYWIDSFSNSMSMKPLLQKFLSEDGKDSLFTLSWKSSLLYKDIQVAQTGLTQECWLLFMHENSLSHQFTRKLAGYGGEVLKVFAGTGFSQVDHHTYTVNPREINSYHQLLENLRKSGKIPTSIVHLWNIIEKEDDISTFDWVEQVQELGLYSLIFLLQAIEKKNFSPEAQFQLMVVTNKMQKIPGQEQGYLEKTTLLGFVENITRKNPGIICRSIDIDSPEPGTRQEEKLTDQLVSEITSKSLEKVVVLRGSDRLVPSHEPIPWVSLERTVKTKSHLKEEGVYLITGGLEGIGFAFAQYLARTMRAKLVLIQWNSQTIENKEKQIENEMTKLRQLEDLGANVLNLSVDVLHPGQIQEAIITAGEKFGPINGVIHTPGVYDESKVIKNTSPGLIDEFLIGILKSTISLENILTDSPLDFFVICSAPDVKTGYFDSFENSALSSFLGFYAYYRSPKYKYPIVSVNWLQSGEVAEELVSKNIENVFKTILNSTLSHVKVIVKPVKKGSNQYQNQIQMESPGETPSLSLINRFDLSSEYVAPTSDIEYRLAGIFQNSLGINRIGILDDFFELGIDSLGTISIGIDIFKEFNIKIPIADLFNLPNVKALSEYILRVRHEGVKWEENVNENLSAGYDHEREVLEVDKSWNPEEISNNLESPGNILLTGASGFLGAHVLKELLENTKANIYCLLRGDTPDKAFHRGKETWNYYFGNQLEKYYQGRICVLKGDITRAHLGMKKNSYEDLSGKIDTVIHCAADVRHFGKYDNFKKTNIEGTQGIIDFCFPGIEKKLHHISTVGILRSPSNVGNFHFKESDLDVGHRFDRHLYLKSKFEAEKLVYRARNKGLKASIYRIGNLVGRSTDGLFQKNISTNVVYNHIKALILLKKFPSNLNKTEIEMAPVDACSRGLVKLVVLKDAIGYNFHLLNSNFLNFKTLVKNINEYGYPIDTVALKTFSDYIHSEVKSERFQKEIEINRIFYLLRNIAENAGDINSRQQSSLKIDREFTVEVLKKTGFSWSEIDFALLSKILNHCAAVGYLEPCQ